MSEQNKAIVIRDIEEIWNNKQLAVADEIYAEDLVRHDPADPEEHRGIGGNRAMVDYYHSVFPDLHIALDDIIGEGDKVVIRWTATGTHQGELMGIPPTGRKISSSGITIARIEDEKLSEVWVNWDALGMLQKLGALEATA